MHMKIFLANRMMAGPAVLVLAVAAVACDRNVDPQQAMNIAAEVTATWAKAYDASDAAALAALYADDARSLPPGGVPLVGRDQIESYWKTDIGEGGTVTKLTPGDAIAQGEFVHIEGTYQVEGQDKMDLATGQYHQLWTRTNDGWRLQREMWRMEPSRSVELAERLTSSWTAAYNAADAKALTALYADEAELAAVPAGSFAGPVAIEAFWQRDFGKGKPSSTLTLTDVYVGGELAHLEGEYKVTDAGAVTEGRYVQLWLRDGKGWHIQREMWWK
jgi:ketosteroid isomerase-like protein